jgi:hypothetical protein
MGISDVQLNANDGGFPVIDDTGDYTIHHHMSSARFHDIETKPYISELSRDIAQDSAELNQIVSGESGAVDTAMQNPLEVVDALEVNNASHELVNVSGLWDSFVYYAEEALYEFDCQIMSLGHYFAHGDDGYYGCYY